MEKYGISLRAQPKQMNNYNSKNLLIQDKI